MLLFQILGKSFIHLKTDRTERYNDMEKTINNESAGIDLFKGKRINIELGTALQIKLAGVSGKYPSTLIGMEEDKYLIIKAPVVTPYGNIAQKYFKGNKIIVRYLYRGKVFGFQTDLIEDLFVPLKLIFLRYPNVIAEHNIRSNERLNCYIPVMIRISEKENYTDGILIDLSEGGCCCTYSKSGKSKISTSLQIDEQVTLKIYFPQVEREQKIMGMIKNIREDKQNTILGLAFQDLAPEIREIIAQYINMIKDLS